MIAAAKTRQRPAIPFGASPGCPVAMARSHPCVTVYEAKLRAASNAVHDPHGGVTDSVRASCDHASRIDFAKVAYAEANS